MRFITFSSLLLSSLASARPSLRQRQSDSFHRQNGVDAVKLNHQFTSLNAMSSCTSGNACINDQFAQCINGKYVLLPCDSGLVCAALPLVSSPGTSITCTTQADLTARLAAAGAINGITSANPTVAPSSTSTLPITSPALSSGSGSGSTNGITSANPTVTPSSTSPFPITSPTPSSGSGSGSTNSSDAQTSLTLLPSVIAANFSQDGLDTCTSEEGEVPSLTSTNNFINWCATLPDLPITNGQQLKNGSCNPAPIGAIPSVSNMPSTKFVSPVNLAVIPSNTTFQITLAVRNLATGYFVNPDTNYLAAPQQLDPTTGFIQGHAHVVIEALESLNQTTPTDPAKFAFFVTLNNKADANGYLYANVTGGLPEGAYKVSALSAAMNHQPVVMPVAQRGISDDTIYVTVAGAEQSTNTTTPGPAEIPSPYPSAVTPVLPSSVPVATQTANGTDNEESC